MEALYKAQVVSSAGSFVYQCVSLISERFDVGTSSPDIAVEIAFFLTNLYCCDNERKRLEMLPIVKLNLLELN